MIVCDNFLMIKVTIDLYAQDAKDLIKQLAAISDKLRQGKTDFGVFSATGEAVGYVQLARDIMVEDRWS
jgi:hypothetical protein